MNQNQTTWKDWVDWAPTYLILGISLAYLTHQTGIIEQLHSSLTPKQSN